MIMCLTRQTGLRVLYLTLRPKRAERGAFLELSTDISCDSYSGNVTCVNSDLQRAPSVRFFSTLYRDGFSQSGVGATALAWICRGHGLLEQIERMFRFPPFITALKDGMPSSDMGRQFVLPGKGCAPPYHASSTCWDLTPEVRLVSGVLGCVSSKLSRASEDPVSASFDVTHKLAIAEYRADRSNGIIRLGHCGSGVVNLLLSLLYVCCIAWIAEKW